jgi:hypothetical protein
LQGPHKPKRRGPHGRPHEKVDLDIVRHLEGILTPSRDPADVQRLHQEDERTKWFGVTRDDTGEMVFEDHGRYAALASETAQVAGTENRYPQLVSFVGVTNAGKSTIVKMLIQRSAIRRDEGFDAAFPSPVVGSVLDDTRTTSGNVNLYIDPAKHLDPLPTLFADCEGFEGGEQAPLGSQYHERSRQDKDGAQEPWINTRPIKWANKDEYRRREYAVTVLYPRILYSFSDCVVFVLRNPKTFGSAALTKLLDWGAAALEKSINQPALPHCIVALNDSHPALDEKQWDIRHATQSLLASVGDIFDGVEGVPQFRRLASHWRKLGRVINNIEDLILCYYSSFKVIRIPAGPQYTLISQQVEKLHATIRADCEASHEAKRRARLLTNTDELDLYLQSGFDHFAAHIDVPFNFMQVSLMRNPIPKDFGGHILQLCEALNSRIPSREPAAVRWMFKELSVVLASCVLLDCARFRKGQLHELFSNYTCFFEYAITEYFQLFCPCSFVSEDGTRMCRSVKARHRAKGHQDERGIIAAGDYVSAFDHTFVSTWMDQLQAAVDDLHPIFSNALERSARVSGYVESSEERIAFAIHVDRLDRLYRSIGPATWVRSNSTCYCCLMDVPQHALPCGHALCDGCARACGDLKQTTLLVSWCPLHPDATRWTQPKVIKYKPRGAGVRVLALDGGGIRGVVQLEILKAIEHALGKHLPVQAFFDLIVGTGTGGLIAVALAEHGRTLDQCQDMFGAVCRQAYNDKNPGRALVKRATRVFGSRSRYVASPLYEALKKEFSDKSNFFGDTTQFRPDVKVAVTATSSTRHKPTLLSNYRRANDKHREHREHEEAFGGRRELYHAYDYDYERSQNPADELKTWQAVYATMADPQYFAPLSSGKQYGGTSKFSKTAPFAFTEAQEIWPEIEAPDLLVSVGTGQNRTAVLTELSTSPAGKKSTNHKPWFNWPRHNGDILDAERVWQDFTSVATTQTSSLSRRRLMRLNVDLGEPPAQDRVSQIQRVSALVRDKLQEEHRQGALTNVANRLIATSFYYQAGAMTTSVHGVRYTVGRISCRYDSHSDYTKRLGKLLLERCNPDFEPFFSIGYLHDESRSKIWMTPTRLSRMCQHGVFDVPEIKLPVGGEPHATAIRLHLLQYDRMEPEGYPISGTLCSKVISSVSLGDQSTASEILDVKERIELPGKKRQVTPLDQLQAARGPSIRAAVSLLKDLSLPSRPATTKPQHVFDARKLPFGETDGTDEIPPPYDLPAHR